MLLWNSDWSGTWDGSGTQDGECRSVEVISRGDGTATLAVTTNRGAVFHFFLEIKGKALKVENIEHRKAPSRGAIMALSEVSGSGRVTSDGFSFTFTCRRVQPGKRNDQWTGTIKATRIP